MSKPRAFRVPLLEAALRAMQYFASTNGFNFEAGEVQLRFRGSRLQLMAWSPDDRAYGVEIEGDRDYVPGLGPLAEWEP